MSVNPGVQELTITIPHREWISANGKYHWGDRATRVKRLRRRGRLEARRNGILPVHPVLVVALIQYATSGRADPANAAPTVKALIDGLTDAGVWPDDDSSHVIGPMFKRAAGKCQKGTHVINLQLIPQEVPF